MTSATFFSHSLVSFPEELDGNQELNYIEACSAIAKPQKRRKATRRKQERSHEEAGPMNGKIARLIGLSTFTVFLVNSGETPTGFSAEQVNSNNSSQASSAAFDPAKTGDRVADEAGKIMKEMILEDLSVSSSHNRRDAMMQMQERMKNLMEPVNLSLANASEDVLRKFSLHYFSHLIPHVENILDDIRKQLATESTPQRRQQLRVIEDNYARNLEDLKSELKGYQASPKEENSGQHTPLEASLGGAIMMNDVREVARILDQGFNINTTRMGQGHTPLHLAADDDRKLGLIELLLARGADVNARDGYGKTPLHHAAGSDCIKVVGLLLKRGAQINASDQSGATPLFVAISARFGDLATVKLLIENGADVSSKAYGGSTPLSLAAHLGKTEILELLQASKTTSGITDVRDDSVFYSALHSGNTTLVERLLSTGYRLQEIKPQGGLTPIHIAVQDDHEEIVDLLLKKGADVNARTSWEATPLHLVARQGSRALMDLLIMRGADVNAQTKDGDTPLHLAAANGRANQAYDLLEKGAKVNATNRFGNTPLLLAMGQSGSLIIEALVKGGANLNFRTASGDTALHVAAQAGRVAVVSALVEKGADINARNQAGSSALYAVAAKGNKDVAELLVAKGADISLLANNGTTPLHAAAAGGHVPLIEFLLTKHVAIDARDKAGESALHKAVSMRQIKVIELLVNRGADINAQTDQGWAPLHIAVSTGQVPVAELLLKRGANVNARLKNGNTPLKLTTGSYSRQSPMASLLEQYGAQ
jgi:ankyrin repeat protein